MADLQRIQKYIDKTQADNMWRYELMMNDWKALATLHTIDAVAMAFLYGRAKGYRAAKAEMTKKVG